MSFKQLQEGQMVFSNDSLHFLKIKNKSVEFTKTILWLENKINYEKQVNIPWLGNKLTEINFNLFKGHEFLFH